MTKFSIALLITVALSFALLIGGIQNLTSAANASPEDFWVAEPFHHANPAASYALAGHSPSEIRAAYNLPSQGGSGTTIAIIDAYDAPTILNDLATFSNQFGLPSPTADNFEVHKMASNIAPDSGWATEAALDVEWAHAIAPQAKILLVEARSDGLTDLQSAISYVRGRPDVVAASMSWGNSEFSTETFYDSRFVNSYGIVFFAASGDSGAGAMWPASSANVIGVGGTTLTMNGGTVSSETGWSGSGGGTSTYEPLPSYQSDYGISGTRRKVPDVSYNANPSTGYAVYCNSNWLNVGGTSAGAPQWAAIHALGRSANNGNLYPRAKSPAYPLYFRDITSGSNGAYAATVGYDTVTGLGSPLTIDFTLRQLLETDTVTLLPSDQSTPLNSTNQFILSYVSNGAQRSTFASSGTTTLNIDAGTSITLAGASTGSNSQEQWVFSSDGATVSGTNMTIYYYDLLLQTANYSVVGVGSPPNASATYVSAPALASPLQVPRALSVTLSNASQTIWALRGTSITVSNPISSTPTEQWSTQPATWPIAGSNQLPQPIVYVQQFLLNVTGVPMDGQWYNSGELAKISLIGVSNRTAGIGQRVTSYSIDGDAPIQVMPTTGPFDVSVQMDGPHELGVITVPQYQVNLDNATQAQLASITPPTITGDTYWYDQATNVSLSINGLSTRISGMGQRISSYTLNGLTTQVSSTGTIGLFNLTLLEPQTVSVGLTDQFEVKTPSGSLESITSPSIAGDTGWYDAGTTLTATYDYSWNTVANQSRLNALSYTLNQGTPVMLGKSGTGTFTVQLTLTSPQTVNVASVDQYFLELSGGMNVSLSQNSPTNDNYFDSGTFVSASSQQTIASADGYTRQVLVSYTLDGLTTTVNRSEVGTFATSAFAINQPHRLDFNSVTQDLVSFHFTSADGQQTILPETVHLSSNTLGPIDLPPLNVWLDKGTQFQIGKVIWQAAYVSPADSTTYTVDKPLNLTIPCRIYSATILIKTGLGGNVSGARAFITLANQTVLQSTSGLDGTILLPLIPQGAFNASVSYQGQTTTIVGDASTQSVAVGIIPAAVTPTATSSPRPSPVSSSSPDIPEFGVTEAIAGILIACTAAALVSKKAKRQVKSN